MLRPATPELARRWLAALLAVPENERAGVVAAVERQIIATYEHTATASVNSPEVILVHPPVAREGYVEQVVVTYSDTAQAEAASADKPSKRSAQRRSQTRA